MANPFTPEEITQILDEYFSTILRRQYIGARYVPIFGRKDEESIEWDNTGTYEPLTIVLYQGNSYTSRQYVPVGVEITNTDYWALTGNYNAQVEQYRRETAAVKERVDNIDAIIPITDFDETNTISAAFESVNSDISDINDSIDTIEGDIGDIQADVTNLSDIIPSSEFSALSTVKTYIDNKTKGLYETHCVDYYGADPTGTTDSSAAIAACIDANIGDTIYFNAGTYLVSEPIRTYYADVKRVHIYGNGATIKPTTSMPYILGYGTKNTSDPNVVGVGYRKHCICDLILDNDNSYADCGIYFQTNCRSIAILNCNIIGFQKGIEAGDGSQPTDLQIDNCCVRYDDTSDTSSVGINFNGTDNKICNSYIMGYHTCIKSKSGLYAFNLHNLPKGHTTLNYATKLQDSLFFELDGGAVIDCCYCDTYEKFIKILRNGDYKITNCNHFSYLNPMTMNFVDVATTSYFQGTIVLQNCTFNCRPTHNGAPTNASILFGDWAIERLLLALNIDNCFAIGDNSSELVNSLVPWDFFKHASKYELHLKHNDTIAQNAWFPIVAYVIDKNLNTVGFETDLTFFFTQTPRQYKLLTTVNHTSTFWNSEDITDLAVSCKNIGESLSTGYEFGYTAVKGYNQTIIVCIYIRNTSSTMSTNMQADVVNECGAFYIDPCNVPRMGWRTYNTTNINQDVFDFSDVTSITL